MFSLKKRENTKNTIVTLSLLHHSDANNPDPDVWNAMLNTTLWFTVYEVWSRIKEFWKDVLDTLSQIVSAKLPECPKLCFLDLFSATPRLYNTKKTIIVFSVLQAKHTNICLLGKNPENPSISQWSKNLSQCLILEKLTFSIKGRPHTVY